MGFFIILIGVAVILIGAWFYSSRQKLKQVCTQQTTGEVIRMVRVEETHTEKDEDGYVKKSKSVNYYPVVRYQAANSIQEQQSSTGTSRPRYTEGQTINIMYDPANEARYYIVGDKAADQFGIYLMLFGVAVAILGVVAIFVPLQ